MKTELSDIGAIQPLSQLIKPQPSDQLPLSFRKRGPERETYLEAFSFLNNLERSPDEPLRLGSVFSQYHLRDGAVAIMKV